MKISIDRMKELEADPTLMTADESTQVISFRVTQLCVADEIFKGLAQISNFNGNVKSLVDGLMDAAFKLQKVIDAK